MFKTNNIQSLSEEEEEGVNCSAESSAYTERASSPIVEEETPVAKQRWGMGDTDWKKVALAYSRKGLKIDNTIWISIYSL
jgi:hypothetical protein